VGFLQTWEAGLTPQKLESGSVEAESIPFSLRDGELLAVCVLLPLIHTVAESSVRLQEMASSADDQLDTVATMAQRKGVEVCLLNAVPEDPDVPIIGDPFRIKQVLLNLVRL
jgi:signal transduction histidine kinase